ncbi:MAG: 30S ribosomal protein S7 [Parcubacteria group bacterium]|nr:30S ribosomal protein S7 [Parcubacteria group bacterium]
MRRPVKKRHIVPADYKYNSQKIEKFVNYVMKDGEKTVARKVVYGALDEIAKKVKTDNPLEVFDKAIKNIGPTVEVRTRRIGGANYQVPREVKTDRRLALAMRWLLLAARGKKGRPIHIKLADEIIAASNNEGEAVQKKANVHKMAEANKAFAHFTW